MRLLLLAILCSPLIGFSQSPPLQQGSGPGGSSYSHNAVIFSDHTSFLNPNGYWLFEPDSPKPDSANLIVFNHGYGVFNPGPYAQWIEHLVRKGNIVVFPKYQISDASLPSTYTNATVTGITDALVEMQTGSGRVRPRLDHYTMIGHSYGGVVTSNIAVDYNSYGLPKPQAILLCQPGTGGINSGRITSYAGMDTDYNMLIIVGDDDIVVGNSFGREIFDSTLIPTAHKNYITHFKDNHGSPNLEASHNEPLAKNNTYDGGTSSAVITGGYVASKQDAVDYYCYWKLADALMNCTYYGTDCNYAFGDTPEQKNMGQWSDGTTVIPLVVEPMVTGIGDHKEKPRAFYPNPAINSINFKEQISGSFEILSGVGKRIKMGPINGNQIDVSDLAPGIYIINIIDDLSPYSIKFMKQ